MDWTCEGVSLKTVFLMGFERWSASKCMHVVHSVGFMSVLVLGIHTLMEVICERL